MRSRAPSLLFLLTIAGVPLAQAGWELARGLPVQALDVFARPSAARLRSFEDELRRGSFIQRSAVPWVQWLSTRFLGRGNEQAIAGRAGWLFYADDLDLVTGPDVLGERRAGGPALETLTALHAALAERGIELVLLPVPTKPMGAPAAFTRWAREGELAQPPGMDAFHRRLAELGVPCLDLRPWLAGCPGGTAYLERDTHWRPERMQEVAALLAGRVAALLEPAASAPLWTLERVAATGRGDTEAMLSLPARAPLFEPEALVLERVRDARTGADWSGDDGAAVLLLGDSFTRVFSDSELGMGSGAGLGEHLAFQLQRPVDVIAMAGGGASGAREALARRAGGLDGVRVVVWQFTLRDLAGPAEGWRWIDLPAASGRGGDETEDSGEAGPREVVAEIVEVSRVDPAFDYDFCLGIVEYEVDGGERIWVAFPLLEEHEPTPQASFEPGDRHRLTLAPVEIRYDLERMSWVDDTDAGLRIYYAIEWEAQSR